MKKNILVLCTGNSCRSQMAHGYLQHLAGNKATVYSAGIEVHGLNPFAVGIMTEDGIDITKHTSNHVDEYNDINFDFVITVCDHAHESCPIFPSTATKLHHNFKDPSKTSGTATEVMEAFRKTRDDIKDYCLTFVREHLM
ncbi:arsenate reductase ArsC [Leptobacterium sp. I13]|uniref:arsenate reductase ArsC n=1 Tax=Leptobacterium meishanense TaxID=3128904 RepID=UPI0030EE77FC